MPKVKTHQGRHRNPEYLRDTKSGKFSPLTPLACEGRGDGGSKNISPTSHIIYSQFLPPPPFLGGSYQIVPFLCCIILYNIVRFFSSLPLPTPSQMLFYPFSAVPLIVLLHLVPSPPPLCPSIHPSVPTTV